jgi:hypothetical protein
VRNKIVRNPTLEDVNSHLSFEDWPLVMPDAQIRKLMCKKIILRPKLWMNKKGIDCILKESHQWSEIKSKLRVMYNDDYVNFLQDLNNLVVSNSKEFYKGVNRLVNYKKKNKIVKKIKDVEVLSEEESCRRIESYYKNLFWSDSSSLDFVYNDCDDDIKIDVDRGINKCAKDKAVGIDGIPEEWYKMDITNMKYKLRKIFVFCLDTGLVPDYWMKSKLILISKEVSGTPKVENTRPVSILPAITKIFEQAIIDNIEKIIFDGWLSDCQRGFVPGWNTQDNLENVLSEYFRVRSEKNSVMVFVDLARAYDNVVRSKLLNLLSEIGLP